MNSSRHLTATSGSSTVFLIAFGLFLVVVFAVVSTTTWIYLEAKHTQKTEMEEETNRVKKACSISQNGAAQVQNAMLSAITKGEFTEEQFFDVNYIPIPASEPAKYHTSYDLFFDRTVQPILDSLITEQYIIFAVASDRNGYLPTHISRFTQPLTGDPIQDRLSNRAKRIFNDPIGVRASKNTGEPLIQRYMRDTGAALADCSTPITVNGKHWGAMRVGVELEFKR